MAKRKYLGSKGAARRLGIAERTVRDWYSKFEWFGGVLENGDLVFTEEEVERMAGSPKPTLGRPPGSRTRRPVVAVPPEMPAPHPEDGPGVEEAPPPPAMPTLPVLAG